MRDRWYCWGCVWAIFVAGAGASAWPGGDSTAAAQKPRAAKTITVDRATVKLLHEVVLSCERAGILGEVMVQEGEVVSEGALLARLKDDIAKATLAVAEAEAASDAEVLIAQKTSEVARVEYEKLEEANKKLPKTIPQVEVRRALLASEKTHLEIDKATNVREVHQLKRDEAKAQLDSYRIDAPFEGFVTKVHLSKGATVRQGDPVIELVSTKMVKVEGFVTLKDALLIRPGAKVSVQLDPAEVGAEAAKRTYPGRLKFVDVKSTPVVHTVRVWAEVENDEMNTLRKDLTPTMTILPSAND